jgi:hypothetical protein
MDLSDTSYPHAFALVLLGCVLLGLVWGLSTSTVALGPYNNGWDGGSDLRTTLDSETTVDVALSTTAYEDNPSAETLSVVVDPHQRYDVADRERLAAFVRGGGTLVVASADSDTNDLLSTLGVTARIDGTPVRDEENNVLSPALPRATEVDTHNYTRDVESLVLNRGTVLEPGLGTVLVRTSPLAYLDENGNEAPDDDERLTSHPVAVREPVGSGTVVVVSDDSVFMNSMLEQDGNRQFVQTLAAAHDRAILDYSHGEPLPPLTYAYLTVRSTPLLQFLLGVSGVGLVAVWGYGLPLGRLRALFGTSSAEPERPEPDEETVAAYLADRHPDWERRRIRRVTKVITRRQQQNDDNEQPR